MSLAYNPDFRIRSEPAVPSSADLSSGASARRLAEALKRRGVADKVLQDAMKEVAERH
jgi:hypothetical protein